MSRRCHETKWPLKGQMAPKHPEHICADWKQVRPETSHHQLEAKECLQGLSCCESSHWPNDGGIGLQVCSCHHSIVPQQLLTSAIELWQYLTQLFVDVCQLECWESLMPVLLWRQARASGPAQGLQCTFWQDRPHRHCGLHACCCLYPLGAAVLLANLSQTRYSKQVSTKWKDEITAKSRIMARDLGAALP